MTGTGPARRRRTGTIVLVAVLAAAVIAFVVVGVVTAVGTPKAGSTASAAAGPSASAAASTSAEPSTSSAPGASASATSTAKPPAVATTTPTPQPTKTAEISKPAPIKKSLTVKVTKLEAVKGVANGPGEIGGPSVRFTIAIDNATGKTVDLSNTVVNAYYGASQTPATQLEQPGGKSFPRSVKDGRTATGVFVFNIPTADRGQVQVTVDTSVTNPVVAFRGSAPK